MTPSDEGQSSAPNQWPASSPEEYKALGFKEFTYSASGKTYTLYVQQKAKGNLGLDKVHAVVRKGKPFTGTNSDDVEVQNMVRDAYRALNLCSEGTHPGIVNFGYGPVLVGDVPTWNVFLKCTEKPQANV